MAANVKPWLWKSSHGLGVNEGRTAFIPPTDCTPSILVSAYNVISEQTTRQHLIKTLATGWACDLPEEAEDVVVKILRSRESSSGQFEFLTLYENGRQDWLLGTAFFSDDGCITEYFLEYISKDQLEKVLNSYSLRTLSEMSKGQGKKGSGDKRALIQRLTKLYIRTQVFLVFPDSF